MENRLRSTDDGTFRLFHKFLWTFLSNSGFLLCFPAPVGGSSYSVNLCLKTGRKQMDKNING